MADSEGHTLRQMLAKLSPPPMCALVRQDKAALRVYFSACVMRRWRVSLSFSCSLSLSPSLFFSQCPSETHTHRHTHTHTHTHTVRETEIHTSSLGWNETL